MKDFSLIKINAIKTEDKDKYILTIGQYQATTDVFDNYEEAEEYLNEHFKIDQQLLVSFINIICGHLYESRLDNNSNNNDITNVNLRNDNV